MREDGRRKLLNELENNGKLLSEQEELLYERDQSLAMNARQVGKIQALEKQLDMMRAECDKLQKANTQMKDDTVQHEQDTIDQLMRQEASLQTVKVKEIDDTLCNFPLCDKPKWHPATHML